MFFMKKENDQIQQIPKMKKLFIYSAEQENRFLLEFREFDPSGNIISEIAFYQDGAVYEKVVHTYIENKLIQSNYFSENEMASHTVSFTYNEEGDVIKESTWSFDGEGVCP